MSDAFKKATKFVGLGLCLAWLSGCENVSHQHRDMEVKDYHTDNQFFEISKQLNSDWTFNGAYIAMAGKERNALTLTTRMEDSIDPEEEPFEYHEYFDYDEIYFHSPASEGSVSVGLKYDTQVVELEFERPFNPAYPFDVDWNFGLQIIDSDLLFLSEEGNQNMSLDTVLAKAGMDFNYALSQKISVYAYADLGKSIADQKLSLHYGAALIFRPVRWLSLSGRIFSFTLQDEEYVSELKVVNNGAALGLAFHF